MVRRYGRLAVMTVALVAVLAAGAAARNAQLGTRTHTSHAGAAPDAGASMDHGAGRHDALALCIAIGGCALAIAGTVAAVRRLAQRGLWAIVPPTTPRAPSVVRPAAFRSRAGPPPALQVFRL